MFRDRTDAAHRLAATLLAYRTKKPLVLAIPRGAVPMAKIIADELNGDLDVVLVRKLRAPQQPELAIGSVNESGWSYVADFAKLYGADAHYIELEKNEQMNTIRQRRADTCGSASKSCHRMQDLSLLLCELFFLLNYLKQIK